MNKPQFVETIKVCDGFFYNLSLHSERLRRTVKHFYNTDLQLSLTSDLIPENLRKGLVKCRVLYSDHIISVDFAPYSFRKIESLALVEDNNIDYSYKATDRGAIEKLLTKKGNSDDILIIKNGLVTDTSYTNLVFENASGLYTPQSYLLRGTKRQLLIDQGIIEEREIKLTDIQQYSNVYLINAMIDLEDDISVSTQNLKQ